MLFAVQEKDRLCQWKMIGGISNWRHQSFSGKPDRYDVPRKGDTIGVARAGNRYPVSKSKHHIFSIHTAAPYNEAADFFYSTYFCLIPNKATKEYGIFIMGVPAIVWARFFTLWYVCRIGVVHRRSSLETV